MTRNSAETNVLVLRAEDVADPHAPAPPTNRRYKQPRLAIETRRLDAVPDGHVRVEMTYVGVCGTDLHLLQTDPHTGFVLTSAPASIPPHGRIIGHEGVGRVLAVGARVRNLAPGAIVALASILACGQCDACRRGALNQCRTARLLGMEIDGLFGTMVDLPASLAHDISDLITSDDDLRAASCLEPAGVALLACERLSVSPADSVVVFGAGPIGVYCAMVCERVFEAAHVAMVEPLVVRRSLAARWCDAVYDVEDYLADPGHAPTVVIEASGLLANVSRVFRRIGPQGRVMLLGRSGLPLGIEAVDHMITQAISLMGSRGHLGISFARTIALHRRGLLPLDGVVTGELGSLDALCAVLGDPGTFAEKACKVIARLDGNAHTAHAAASSVFT